jgi:hypothetical protein
MGTPARILTSRDACNGELNKTADGKERFFSIELESKASLKNMTLANGSGNESVLVEGTIGKLQRAEFAEGVVLEVFGSKGVLRINLAEKEIGANKTATIATAGGASA